MTNPELNLMLGFFLGFSFTFTTCVLWFGRKIATEKEKLRTFKHEIIAQDLEFQKNMQMNYNSQRARQIIRKIEDGLRSSSRDAVS